MKFSATLTALVASIAMLTAASAATSTPPTTNKQIQMAEKKLKTIKHKVQVDNCQQKRKEIMNRCKYHHKMGLDFCQKQDQKNAAVCANLKRKAEENAAKKEESASQNKAADERFNACIRTSGCDKKADDTATKWCYDHCHKRAGYSN